MHELTIATKKSKEVIDITEELNDFLRDREIESGLLHVHLLHTTAALTTADLDPGTDLDMLDAFYAMVPQLKYRHPHDPSHVRDHILSSIIGTQLLLPFGDNGLILGTWQRAVLIELDGPRERKLVLSIVK